MDKLLKVWYLYHSGFAVEYKDNFLIFDYYLDKPDESKHALSTGVIDPHEINNQSVYVFSSHRHPDHFNPVILDWKKDIPTIKYILSSDIPKKYHQEGMTIMKPYQTQDVAPYMTVSTLRSTDEGVAFLITVDDCVIYHAGDLNWWHWEEESKAWNNDMAAKYKNEMDQLKGKNIDIAFLTLDPRQEEQAFWGAEYFLGNVAAKVAFPMHFSSDYSIMNLLENKKALDNRFEVMKTITKRGEYFELTI